ncbi:MAG: flagellar biosynthetic protein FliQ [Armatimonadetes bacterium]|nr:flagellar biosynthetic protein FliQ [Armatimonadota bacterium]
MSVAQVLSMVQDAVWVAVMTCTPLLLVTAVVGLIVALLQAVTQVNEPSLNFIPKLVASGLVLVVAGSWMLQALVAFVSRMLDGPHAT